MPSILIADACKASLVMTSEAIKDNFTGAVVSIVNKGLDCIEQVKNKQFDLIIIDFELPDTDAITLTKLLRKFNNIPILITAYPDKSVSEAIDRELFLYEDARSWVKKPIHEESFTKQVRELLRAGRGLAKSFKTELNGVLTVKSKEGKRSQRVRCQIVDISLDGVKVSPENSIGLSSGERVILSCKLSSAKTASLKEEKTAPTRSSDLRVNSKVTQLSEKGTELDLEFFDISDNHKKNLEKFLRNVHQNQLDS